MERALRMPEIVGYILQQVDRSSQAYAARTCRFWSCIALDWLWHDMDSIYPLFEILSPLEVSDGGFWHFSLSLSGPTWDHAKWDHFEGYASRIRSITHDQGQKYRDQEARPSQRLFVDVVQVWHHRRPMTPLLCNVFDVKWICRDTRSLSPVLHFISPSVTKLEIRCDAIAAFDCSVVFEKLTQQNLSLDTFLFAAERPSRDYVPNLVTFLHGQKGLVTAYLPAFTATREIVSVVGGLPLLKSYASYSLVQYQTPIEAGMCFKWEPGTFEVLEKLGFEAWPCLMDGITQLQGLHTKNLRSLKLAYRSTFHTGELFSLTSTLATVHDNLTHITLALFAREDINLVAESISFDCIRPLLQCGALSALNLWHSRVMAYTQGEIAAMASAWPCMETLQFFHDPVIGFAPEMGQPLETVATFIREFPLLSQLGVYVNIVSAKIPETLRRPLATTPKLKLLDFGTSPCVMNDDLAVERKISLYLSSITAPGIEICGHMSDGHIRGLEMSEADEAEYDSRFGFWFDIGTRVELVHEAVRQTTEEMRTLALQNRALLEEVQTLRQSQGLMLTPVETSEQFASMSLMP
ncbi:hypothetical protein FRB95_013090 [Tulasnella sp. JGI-2019a]|nr:hypothetical protein FRB95_013090 [Tulasnella sp. JGI-2019a]